MTEIVEVGQLQIPSSIGKWKAYSAYKDSGIEWLGEIPEHWEIQPLKYMTQFINGAAFKPNDWKEEGVPIIRIENLNGGEEFHKSTMSLNSRYFVAKGDILFGWSGNRGTSFGPFIWDIEGRYYLNQHIFRLEGFDEDKYWLYWLLKAVTAYVESQAHGIIGLVHITKQDLGSIYAAKIISDEQHAIATFLDHEIVRINTLIAKKERLIELLQEKRAALISHAVTKGLDPDAKMKDSGVEWLGEIPEHWDARQFKHVAEISYGLTLELDRTETVGTPIISLPNVTKQGQLLLDDVPLTPLTSNQEKNLLLRKGDLLFNWRNGSSDHVGKTAYFDADGEYTHVSFLLRIRFDPIRFVSRYYQMSLNNLRNTEFFSSAKNRVNKTYNQTELGRLKVMVPPLEEQRMIATYLERETAKIDALVSKIGAAIEKLKEYSTALISAAVTGKIDVRGEGAITDE